MNDDAKQTDPTINFMRNIVECQKPVTIFLTNGVKLNGRITWEGAYKGYPCMGLTRDGHTQLVNLSGIATIMPNAPGNA